MIGKPLLGHDRAGKPVVCPICREHGPFVLWITPDELPIECPEGPHVKNVTQCRTQMAKAQQTARWMKLCPEAFDETGALKPGGLGMVLDQLPSDDPHPLYLGGGFIGPPDEGEIP